MAFNANTTYLHENHNVVKCIHPSSLIPMHFIRRKAWLCGYIIRGISLQNLPEATKVIRCMPNTPVIVRNGVTIYASGSCVTEQDRELLTGMLNEIGVSMEMQEHYMDIITGLTGCGPSYVSQCVIRFSARNIIPAKKERNGASCQLRRT